LLKLRYLDSGLSTASKLYDFFTAEDRSLFLSCKRALSPTTLQSLADEAGGDPCQLDLLIMKQVFGVDRQQQYAHLTSLPVHFDRANPSYPKYV